MLVPRDLQYADDSVATSYHHAGRDVDLLGARFPCQGYQVLPHPRVAMSRKYS